MERAASRGRRSSDSSAATREQRDYYQVLGVPFEAAEEEIRKRYHDVVRTLHPDRRRPGGSGGGEALERFHQVQSAWRCLSDPTRRLLYDLRNFGRSSLGEDAGVGDGAANPTAEAKLICLQKEQAVRDVHNMEVVLERILRREKASRGILVRSALYGDLRLRDDRLEECLAGQRSIEVEDLLGPLIDVTVPVQCLVEQHTIVLPGGTSTSKADLPGFYNPAPLDSDVELSLYVLYEFKGLLHEVLVGDHETLSLPFRKHAVPAGKAPRGPFSPANVELLRRRAASAAAPAAAAGGAGPQARAGRASSEAALERAVADYCLHRLGAGGPGEATRREFAAVVMGLGLAVFLAIRWPVGGSGHRW
mmetsp:Transcript_24052/g.54302  ORF Transcript_24052/g.54302 Transcript_24052/m.54302 type:complete len:363 (-) Transcript_24052:70-1158(-)